MLKYCENLPFGLELISDSIIKKNDQMSKVESLNQIKMIVNYFINNPSHLVVPVYGWFEGRKTSGYYEYSYTMKRLFLLSQEEKQIVDRSYYFYNKAPCPYKNGFEIIEQAQTDNPELLSFCKEVVEQNRYWDFHTGNVLKDELGDYKLIDLEGFMRNSIDSLTWIPKEL